MNQKGVYKKHDMKNFIIIGAIFIVGCSKLPWKKDTSSPDELFEEEPQVELNQH